MGDRRFDSAYDEVAHASHREEAIDAMGDEELISALAGASRARDPLLANVLATAALNRTLRARSAFVHMADGGLVADERGQILDANPAAERLLGWTHAQLRQERVHAICEEEHTPESCPLLEALRDGRKRHLETRFRARSGRTFPVSVTTAPVLRHGHPEGVVVVFDDISQRRAAEARLRESEERWRILADATSEGIVVHEHGRVVAYNRAAVEMFRTGETDMRGRSVLGFVTLGSQGRIQQAIEARSDEPYVVEGLRADGEPFPVELRGRSLTWRGRPARVVVLRDLSGETQAQTRLAHSEQTLRAILDAHPSAVIAVDRNGCFLAINSAAAGLVAIDPEAWVGRPFAPLVPPDDIGRTMDAFRRVLEGESATVDVSVRHASGKLVPMRFQSVPLRRNGVVEGVLSIGQPHED